MAAEPIGNGNRGAKRSANGKGSGQDLETRRARRPPGRGTRARRPAARAAVVVERPPVADTTHVLVAGDSFVGQPIGGRRPRDLVEPTRVRLRLARVGPLSVLWLSLLFGVLAMAALVAGLAVLYTLLQTTGVLHSIEKLVNTSGVGHHFHFDGGWLFTRVGWVAAGMVVVGSIIAACLAILYNSLADLTGGLDVTFAEHPSTVLAANETPTWVTRFRGVRLSRMERLQSDGQGPGAPEPPPS